MIASSFFAAFVLPHWQYKGEGICLPGKGQKPYIKSPVIFSKNCRAFYVYIWKRVVCETIQQGEFVEKRWVFTQWEEKRSRGRGKKNAALVCAARFPVYNLMKSFESVVKLIASFCSRRRCFWLTLQKCGRLSNGQRTKKGICWMVNFEVWSPKVVILI
jgi:hypothetical protein